MDIALASTTSKSPDAEPVSETPTRIQPIKPTSLSNGVLKRHKPHHNNHAPPVVITYKECLKNHAATLGGHALDGCGEFMPSSTATPADPTSLKCAACGCHRNFHRREPDDPLPTTATPTLEYQPHHRHHPPPPPLTNNPMSPNSSSPPPISSSYYPSAPHMLLALSNGLPHAAALGSNSNTKKRFRTKFTQFQKDKMLEFADKIGWRIQKQNEDDIRNLCHELGVDRCVLKVWMHNNKNTFCKKDQAINGGSSYGNGIEDVIELNDDKNGQNLNHHHFETDSVAHVGTNGCSSSSS